MRREEFKWKGMKMERILKMRYTRNLSNVKRLRCLGKTFKLLRNFSDSCMFRIWLKPAGKSLLILGHRKSTFNKNLVFLL
jgi:hypothetical protein